MKNYTYKYLIKINKLNKKNKLLIVWKKVLFIIKIKALIYKENQIVIEKKALQEKLINIK